MWVVVLGDFGRSPRMQNHALSLAQQGGLDVDVVALKGAEPCEELRSSPAVTLRYIPDIPGFFKYIPGLLRLVVKAAWQLVALLMQMLFRLPKPDVILLQVPPAVPILAVCSMVAWLRGARLVVDWHNFGYTIMAITMGPRHPLVLLSRRFERNWARGVSAHLCVTRAMQQELLLNWGLRNVTVFYDRPPEKFRRASVQEQHRLMLRVRPVLEPPLHPHDCAVGLYSAHEDGAAAADVETPTTVAQRGAAPALRPGRPALVVSSTSWTPDEDFGILLQAAQEYDAQATEQHPNLLVVVTGSGPMKQTYLQQMRQLDLKRVAFRTGWLESEDYPLLLGSADLGVCLHTSSSGLDLPMKVVDMFGAGLPVCAVGYACLDELVAHGKNGMVFTSPTQLTQQWLQLLDGFPEKPGRVLQELRHVVEGSMAIRWEDSWRTTVWPVVKQQLAGGKQGRHN